MNIFYTGRENGYIGKSLAKAGLKLLRCDVTDKNDVERAICSSKPDIVLHLAAKSSPDFCEQKKHVKEAVGVNFRGTHNVMEMCVHYKIPAVLFSTAQIWGGGWFESLINKHSENSPYSLPVNCYGAQKMSAEKVVSTSNMNGRDTSKIIRISHVFNQERFHRELTELRRLMPVDAPRFLKRSFVHTDDFVTLVTEYCKRFNEMPPVLHLAGSKTVSYYQFWSEVAKQVGVHPRLVRGRWFEKDIYSAKRPHNGGLDTSLAKSLGFPQFDYIGGIQRMLNES